MLFGILMFRAWEIRKSGIENLNQNVNEMPKFYFRHIEKIMLYFTKRLIHWIILIVVKYWFVFYTKFKKWILTKLPKIYGAFRKTINNISNKYKKIIGNRTFSELKIKIRRIKEKVRRENEISQTNNQPKI